MDWTAPQWWIVFLGACASFVLSCVNIAWTWKQSKRIEDEVRKKNDLDAAAIALIDEFVEFGSGMQKYKNAFLGVRREQWEAAVVAERWGALNIRWDNGNMQARVAVWNDKRSE